MHPAPFVRHPARPVLHAASVVKEVDNVVQAVLEHVPDAHVHALRYIVPPDKYCY